MNNNQHFQLHLIRLSLEYIKMNGNLNENASTDEKQKSSVYRKLEESNDEFQKLIRLQESFQNIPVLSSMQMKEAKASKKRGCSLYPEIIDIKFSNTYWQIFRNQSSTLYLYGAYLGKFSSKCNECKYFMI